MAQISVLKTAGIGRVDTNKPLGSKEIEVVPTEWIPMRDGELTSNATVNQFTSTNVDGNVTKGAVVGANTIKATWMPNGTNRLSAPDVRRGERVELLQVADEDKYYWRTLGLDDHLRKLETIIFGISASKVEQKAGSKTVLSPDNMYWFEFSSHSKKLAFSSCKADGEPYLYEAFFDFLEGEFMVKDDVGNFQNMRSADKLIHLQNGDGSFIKVDRKDVKITVPQDVIVTAARDVTINAGRNFIVKAGTMAKVDGGGSIFTLTGGSTTLKTPTFQGST